MLILITLFLLLKAQKLMSMLSFYQQNAIKSYQNFLAKDLKDQKYNYQKVLLRIVTSSSMETAFMTNHLILI